MLKFSTDLICDVLTGFVNLCGVEKAEYFICCISMGYVNTKPV
jgi:hypothetical protein